MVALICVSLPCAQAVLAIAGLSFGFLGGAWSASSLAPRLTGLTAIVFGVVVGAIAGAAVDALLCMRHDWIEAVVAPGIGAGLGGSIGALGGLTGVSILKPWWNA